MKLLQKRLFNSGLSVCLNVCLCRSLFVIACAKILMRLCLHHLCLGYLAQTDQQSGCLLFANPPSPVLFKKKPKPEQTRRWGGGPSCAGKALSMSLRSGSQFVAFLEHSLTRRLCLSPSGRGMFCCWLHPLSFCAPFPEHISTAVIYHHSAALT